ncbi:hypothetical protein ACJX0J_036444, partial [Zea mays]
MIQICTPYSVKILSQYTQQNQMKQHIRGLEESIRKLTRLLEKFRIDFLSFFTSDNNNMYLITIQNLFPPRDVYIFKKMNLPEDMQTGEGKKQLLVIFKKYPPT